MSAVKTIEPVEKVESTGLPGGHCNLKWRVRETSLPLQDSSKGTLTLSYGNRRKKQQRKLT